MLENINSKGFRYMMEVVHRMTRQHSRNRMLNKMYDRVIEGLTGCLNWMLD